MRLAVLDVSRVSRVSGAATAPHASVAAGPRSMAAVKVLRVSLTDRCNFRCVYCMPAGGVPWLSGDELLSVGELLTVIRAAVEVHGIRRLKLTGGEPTVRRDLPDLVRQIRAIDGVEEVSLTTNGMLLNRLTAPLRDAGLDRVTISLDSLRPERFRRITRVGDLSTVLAGVEAATGAFAGVKINCVVVRGTNDDETAEFAGLTRTRAVTVRFIEYMPLGSSAVLGSDEKGPAGGCGGGRDAGVDAGDVGAAALVSEAEVRGAIERVHGPLRAVDRSTEPGVGPATVWRLGRDAAGRLPVGRVGFISAMSRPFCDTCNRLRLTASGVLRSCLFEGGEVDVRPILRGGSGATSAAVRAPIDATVDDSVPTAIGAAMTRCIAMKPVVHGAYGREPMSRVGG